MSLNVFILGRPGSGKSRVAQFIQGFASEKGWTAEHIYDYKLLQVLFLQETATKTPLGQRKFRPRGPKASQGFDVTNYEVLDTVLYQMAHWVRTRKLTSLAEKKLLLIEFARNKYDDALRKFGDGLLQDAFLLYIDADMENCIERISQRVGNGSEFSHFVSEDIMRRYYYKDDWLEDQFQEYLKSLQRRGVCAYPKEIDNKGSIEQLIDKIKEIVEVNLLQETESLPIVSRMFFGTELTK